MSIRISRSLAYERTDGERRVVGQDEIASFYETVVILGDPGLGKSVLCRALGERPGMKYVGAGRFVNAPDPGSLAAEGERIIIDGLDEIASSVSGGAVDGVLRQLARMGDPPFILFCREADWRGGADSVKIEDERAGSLVVLHLQPFDYDDAREFLSHEFPDVEGGRILEHLAERGIEDLCRNPLTLRMLGEVAQEKLYFPIAAPSSSTGLAVSCSKRTTLGTPATRTRVETIRRLCSRRARSVRRWCCAITWASMMGPTPKRRQAS